MIWQNDIPFDEYGYNGDGNVTLLKCSNEDCGALAEFKIKD